MKKRLVIILLTISFICLSAVPKKIALDEYWVYPNYSSPAEWEKLTVEERRAACRIPKRIRKNMSDEQLIQAVVDYPYIIDVYCYTYIKTGVEAVEMGSDAYVELISRETGFDSLMNYFRQEAARMEEEMTTQLYSKVENLAALILFQEKFQDDLTSSDIEFILSVSTMVDEQYNR